MKSGEGLKVEMESLIDFTYLSYYPRTMAKQLRFEYDRALYHITSRGLTHRVVSKRESARPDLAGKAGQPP
jgi:hypothetical protein